jgi:hypothetical protein
LQQAAETIIDAPEPTVPLQQAAETIIDAPKPTVPLQQAAETIIEAPKPEEPDVPAAAETIIEAPTQQLDVAALGASDSLLAGPADSILAGPADSILAGPADSILAGPAEELKDTTLEGTAEATADVDSLFLKSTPGADKPTPDVTGPSPGPPKPIPQPAIEITLDPDPVPPQEQPQSPSVPAALSPTQPLSMTVSQTQSLQTRKPEPEPDPVSSQANSTPTDQPKVDLDTQKPWLQSKSAPNKKHGTPPPTDVDSGNKSDLDSQVLKPTQKPAKAQESTAFNATTKATTPGGGLKFLEQALAQSVPGKLPTGLKKKAVTAVRHLFTLTNVQRVAVLAKNDQGKVEALAVGGLSPDKESMEQIPARLLRAVLRSDKALLLPDCIRDPRYAKDPIVTGHEIRSVICAPFTDTASGTVGLLYVDNCAAPNAFSNKDLEHLTQFAHKMGTQADLSEFDSAPQRSTSPDSLNVEVEPVSPWLYVSLVLGALILVMPALYNAFFGDTTPKNVKPSVNSQPIENPAAVIQGFIRALDAKSYGGAYTYLSEGLQARISEEEFDKRLKSDLAKYDKAWRLSRVNIRAGSVDQESLKSFRVTVGHNGPWLWTLQKSAGKWYIHEFEGGLDVP